MSSPSLQGRTVLITGATDGLGRALAMAVAQAGARVLVHGRDAQRIDDTLAELEPVAGAGRLAGYQADLAALAEVRALARAVRDAEPRLDVLVNNAGIGTQRPGGGARQVSADGHELRFAVNYLAGFALTHELLGLLRASAPSRIVNVASAGQSAIDFDDVMLERGYDGMRAYGQSKLAQILFTRDLAAELQGSGVTSAALHPATYMPTKMVPFEPRSTIAEGVEATFRLVAAPDPEARDGRYFNGLREARPDPQADDPEARRALRELSERLTAA
jgi:NAD(P)-dependent dehydrogenase (short-subunit alcohol dehydrogenase family)